MNTSACGSAWAGGSFVLLLRLFAAEAGAPFAVVGEAWRGGRLKLGSWELPWRSLFDTRASVFQSVFQSALRAEWRAATVCGVFERRPRKRCGTRRGASTEA